MCNTVNSSSKRTFPEHACPAWLCWEKKKICCMILIMFPKKLFLALSARQPTMCWARTALIGHIHKLKQWNISKHSRCAAPIHCGSCSNHLPPSWKKINKSGDWLPLTVAKQGKFGCQTCLQQILWHPYLQLNNSYFGSSLEALNFDFSFPRCLGKTLSTT